MPNLMFLCQSGIWPILCQLMAILANLLDIDFKFVILSNYFDIQTKFEVNLTIIGHSFSGFWAQNIYGLYIKVNGNAGKNKFEVHI